MGRDQMIFGEFFDGNYFGPVDGFEPREWQWRFLRAYTKGMEERRDRHPTGQDCFCLYAGTGSGKTKAAGLLVAHMLNAKLIDQVVFVCPNIHIAHKTSHDFKRFFKVKLGPLKVSQNDESLGREWQGYSVTYQTLNNDPVRQRSKCDYGKTMVIFDEIHHLGDESGSWGRAAVKAFGSVPYVLALTGTPYRSDNTPIPFVTYEKTSGGELVKFKADFTYSLGQAVADGVCRIPKFNTCDETVTIRNGFNSGTRTYTFGDTEISDPDAANRLRGAVMAGSLGREKLLSNSLPEIKAAGRKVGIFLGGDNNKEKSPTQDAEEDLPRLLQELGYTEDDYEIVTHKNKKDAAEKIRRFGASKKWILVSVNMLSEGIDIPELSAAILLTTITAKQTTVQRFGRVLRMRGHDDPIKEAWIYLFDDYRYREMCLEIQGEVDREINLKAGRDAAISAKANGDDSERFRRTEVVCHGDFKRKAVICLGKEVDYETFVAAEAECDEEGLPRLAVNAIAFMCHNDRLRRNNNSIILESKNGHSIPV